VNTKRRGKRNSCLEDNQQTYHPFSNIIKSGDTGGDYIIEAGGQVGNNIVFG
jgi:hypothetical protein